MGYIINISSVRKGGDPGNPHAPTVRGDRANPILGNPFILHNHKDDRERAYVIAEYRKWADEQMATNPIYQQEIRRIAELLLEKKEVNIAC